MPPIWAFPAPRMCSLKYALQGHFQCLACVAGNGPYRGIFNVLNVKLEMLPTRALLVPYMYS